MTPKPTLIRIAIDPETHHPVCHIPSKRLHEHVLGLLRANGAIRLDEAVEFAFDIGPSREAVEALLVRWEERAKWLNEMCEDPKWGTLAECISELRALMPKDVEVVPGAGEAVER